MWAMLRAVMGATTIDHFRYTIEQMPPAEYLASSYYARWLWAVEHLAAEQGILDSPDAPPKWRGRRRRCRCGTGGSGPAIGSACATRSRAATPGCRGTSAGTWAPSNGSPSPGPTPPKSAATGTYGEPELVYTVAFAGADLFGPAADHTLTADLGESDLEEPEP